MKYATIFLSITFCLFLGVVFGNPTEQVSASQRANVESKTTAVTAKYTSNRSDTGNRMRQMQPLAEIMPGEEIIVGTVQIEGEKKEEETKTKPKTKAKAKSKVKVKKSSDKKSNDSSENYINANVSEKHYSLKSFRRDGRYYDASGYNFTWYSETVLPGPGLKIPGRHVNDEGYVCDADGNICLASTDFKKGTIIKIPFGDGLGKVYDECPTSGTIDVYIH